MISVNKLIKVNIRSMPQGDMLLKTGLAGFEPTSDGVKVRCLTAWL